jgi:hypothetical protein
MADLRFRDLFFADNFVTSRETDVLTSRTEMQPSAVDGDFDTHIRPELSIPWPDPRQSRRRFLRGVRRSRVIVQRWQA